MFEHLVRPLLPALDRVTSLYIVPDRRLYAIPFGAIPADEDRMLADLFAITYLEAVRDLLHTPGSPAAAMAPIVIAGPDYGLAPPPAADGPDRPDAAAAPRHLILPHPENSAADGPDRPDVAATLYFPPLPGAAEEGALVAALLGTVAITGTSAVKSRLTALSSPRILHLATHGYYIPIRRAPGPVNELIELVSVPGEGTYAVKSVPVYVRQYGDLFHETRSDNPMLRSGLALAGANTWVAQGTPDLEADNGIVSSADISALDLRSTELVVLSACETGLGEIDAEGVIGVRRAFVLAGTKSLICSLWRVPDKETKRLMELFYKAVSKGTLPVLALKHAQDKLRAEGLPSSAWAAFIHIGLF